MGIDFKQIPAGGLWRVPGPYMEFDSRLAFGGLFRAPQRVLVIGQKLVAGSAPADTPIQVLRPEDAVGLFGQGSMLHAMFVALKEANNIQETHALPLDDDGAAAAAAGTATIGGAITAAGTLFFYAAGTRLKVGVAATDTPALVATALAAAINGDPNLPVTAVVNVGVAEQVDITARHKGEAGNDIDLRVNYHAGEALPPGMTIAFVAMAGGTANPDIANAVAAVGDEPYDHIVMPYTDAANLVELEGFLDARWHALVQRGNVAYSMAAGSHGALTTLGSGRNSELSSILGADGSPTPPWVWAAAYGGKVGRESNSDPARPFDTVELPGVLPPTDPLKLFSTVERNLLLFKGISTWTVTPDGKVQIERAITTYQKNSAGLPDPAYLDVTTPLTLGFLRFDFKAWATTTFPRRKLAQDGTPIRPGSATITPGVFRDHVIGRYGLWQDAGLVDDIEGFKKDLVVEINASDPTRLDALMPIRLVNPLTVIAVLVEFRL